MSRTKASILIHFEEQQLSAFYCNGLGWEPVIVDGKRKVPLCFSSDRSTGQFTNSNVAQIMYEEGDPGAYGDLLWTLRDSNGGIETDNGPLSFQRFLHFGLGQLDVALSEHLANREQKFDLASIPGGVFLALPFNAPPQTAERIRSALEELGVSRFYLTDPIEVLTEEMILNSNLSPEGSIVVLERSWKRISWVSVRIEGGIPVSRSPVWVRELEFSGDPALILAELLVREVMERAHATYKVNDAYYWQSVAKNIPKARNLIHQFQDGELKAFIKTEQNFSSTIWLSESHLFGAMSPDIEDILSDLVEWLKEQDLKPDRFMLLGQRGEMELFQHSLELRMPGYESRLYTIEDVSKAIQSHILQVPSMHPQPQPQGEEKILQREDLTEVYVPPTESKILPKKMKEKPKYDEAPTHLIPAQKVEALTEKDRIACGVTSDLYRFTNDLGTEIHLKLYRSPEGKVPEEENILRSQFSTEFKMHVEARKSAFSEHFAPLWDKHESLYHTEDGRPYYLLKLPKAKHLAPLFPYKDFREWEKKQPLFQILSILEYFHKKNQCLRFLNPEMFIVDTEQQNTWIWDLGLAGSTGYLFPHFHESLRDYCCDIHRHEIIQKPEYDLYSFGMVLKAIYEHTSLKNEAIFFQKLIHQYLTKQITSVDDALLAFDAAEEERVLAFLENN